MNERIKLIRKEQGLTLEKFGQKVGLKRNSLSQIENGVNKVTEQLIKLVCSEFKVNETWLRTGIGDKYIKQSREDALIDRLNEIMANEDARLQKAVLNALLNMDNEGWRIMDKFLTDIIKNIDSNESAASSAISEQPPTIESAEAEYIKKRSNSAPNMVSSVSSSSGDTEEAEKKKQA